VVRRNDHSPRRLGVRQVAGSYHNDRPTKGRRQHGQPHPPVPQGDARRWGLAIPRRHGRHVSDAVVESLVTSVDERWEKGPWCVGLAVEETGVGRVHVAISLSIVHLGG